MHVRLLMLSSFLLLLACNGDSVKPIFIPQPFDNAADSEQLTNSDWNYRKIPFSRKGDIQDFAFLDEMKGGVIMQHKELNYVWLTQDGGESWQLLPGTEFIKFLNIHAFDNGELLLSGSSDSGFGLCREGPYQWRSTDGGKIWTETIFDRFDHYAGFSFRRDGTGYRKHIADTRNTKEWCTVGFGGSNHTLVRSVTHGREWEEQMGCGLLWDPNSSPSPDSVTCFYNTNMRQHFNTFAQDGKGLFVKSDFWLFQAGTNAAFHGFTPYPGLSVFDNRYYWDGSTFFAQSKDRSQQFTSTDLGKNWTPANYPEAAGGKWFSVPGTTQIIATDGNQFCLDEVGDFSFDCFDLPNGDQFAPLPRIFERENLDYFRIEIIDQNRIWTIVDDGLVYLSRP